MIIGFICICLIVLICMVGKFVCLFFFSSKKMADPFFKNRTDLKREYRIMVKTILPLLNDCGYCGKIKCIYSSKFCLDCSSCFSKCKNCFEFNKSKDILINCGDEQISNYVKNFFN